MENSEIEDPMDWELEFPGALKSSSSIPVLEDSAMDGNEPVVHELFLPEEVEMVTAEPNSAENTGSGNDLAERIDSFAVSLSSAAKPKSILRRQATATSGITSSDLRECYLWDVDDTETQLAVLEGYAMASAELLRRDWL